MRELSLISYHVKGVVKAPDEYEPSAELLSTETTTADVRPSQEPTHTLSVNTNLTEIIR